jgi:hypothetical protein
VTQTTVARALLGLRNVGATLTNGQIDCANPIVQSLFDPTNSPPLLHGHAIVEYANPDGTFSQGCRAGTSILGLDTNPGDANGDGFQFNDPGDTGLSINIPSRVNAGGIKVSGLESNVTWQPPIEPFGGRVIVNADMTVNLYRLNPSVTIFGIAVTDPTDDTGSLSSGFAAQVNIWRGSLSGTWLNDKHSITLRANYVGGLAPLGGVPNLLGAASVPGATATNINPPDPSLCTVGGQSIVISHPLPIRNGDFPQLEPFFTGDGPRNPDCSFTHGQFLKTDPQIQVGATWRYTMNPDTTFSVSVENLLDADPPLFPATYLYNPFGSAGSEGRTIKIGIQKKFPR